MCQAHMTYIIVKGDRVDGVTSAGSDNLCTQQELAIDCCPVNTLHGELDDYNLCRSILLGYIANAAACWQLLLYVPLTT